ncbi:DA1-like domain-containing protein [Heracleum sosnowskyi]|uniref:DA1-like domain-containing protein n=1 Tax=Heracleum sosnowskyi TaxID=360622 RepID=A0AAD8M4I4_9APIA|nr:DA1-like domain-containing protein [Heracleum sosnowskyi]
MEYNGGYMNGGYGAFTFEDPLSEDENEDIHHAVQYSILESNSAVMNFVGSLPRQKGIPTVKLIKFGIPTVKSIKFGMFAESLSRQKGIPTVKLIKFGIPTVKSIKFGMFAGSLPRQKGILTVKLIKFAIPTVKSIKFVIFAMKNHNAIMQKRVCDKHLSDGSTKCCSCSRFKIGNMRFISLNDGRKLCSDCHCTAIMDTEACIPLFHEVYRFLEGIDMKILKDIPIFLVDEKDMNKISGKDRTTYGMTTYGIFVVHSVARSYQRGEIIYVEKEVQNIRRIHKVTSMMILYGFPRLVIGATIAHEMIHAWMAIEGYRNGLRSEMREGICEVMAHKWLDWYAFVGDDFLHTTPEQAEFLRYLKEVEKNKIEVRDDESYGQGFREAKWAIERYGLRRTMSYASRTGKFPQ